LLYSSIESVDELALEHCVGVPVPEGPDHGWGQS